ncbi:MAG: hypothetical protein CVU91_06835 [Firmicutes bacterium HGW-Firmicutes-16]|nr:MAG: hypothetical protein CVU91_06835 [Firmicutes bacterium HGW-Firmicutes-16]
MLYIPFAVLLELLAAIKRIAVKYRLNFCSLTRVRTAGDIKFLDIVEPAQEKESNQSLNSTSESPFLWLQDTTNPELCQYVLGIVHNFRQFAHIVQALFILTYKALYRSLQTWIFM